MRRSRIRLTITCTLAMLVLPACAGGAAEPTPGPTPGSEMTAAEIEALYAARTDSARLRFTAADVNFMKMMIAHHAQALVMARLAPTHGASPAIQRLAARIINAQEDEIATMERWLRERGQEVPEFHIQGTELTVHGAEHALHMTGMATPEQLRELDRAHGAEFDRLFLRLMIAHHQGAITMVHELFRTDAAAQDEEAFRLATDIQADQITEIARMQSMLSQLQGGSDTQ